MRNTVGTYKVIVQICIVLYCICWPNCKGSKGRSSGKVTTEKKYCSLFISSYLFFSWLLKTFQQHMLIHVHLLCGEFQPASFLFFIGTHTIISLPWKTWKNLSQKLLKIGPIFFQHCQPAKISPNLILCFSLQYLCIITRWGPF